MFILIIKQKASISVLLDRMVCSGNSLKFLECSAGSAGRLVKKLWARAQPQDAGSAFSA